MALRKYNAVRGGDSANHTSDGFIIPKTGDGDGGGGLTVNAGTATSLPDTASPTVTNSGTETYAIFDFGIPKGKDGVDGVDGVDGQCQAPNFSVYGESGDHSAAYISGSYPSLHIDFVIQRGEKGDKGDMGDSGNATYNYYYYYSSCECPPPDLSGYIQEAPNDGQPYVRINGSWAPLYNYAT